MGCLSVHIKENFRILKPGSFCAWFVNDFRVGGVFYPYHVSVENAFIEAGFIPFNIYIVDLGIPIGQAFVQSIVSTKIFPKCHEYCLIFQKPGKATLRLPGTIREAPVQPATRPVLRG